MIVIFWIDKFLEFLEQGYRVRIKQNQIALFNYYNRINYLQLLLLFSLSNIPSLFVLQYNQEDIIWMGNRLYAEIKSNTVFIYSPSFQQCDKSPIEQKGLIIRHKIQNLHYPIFQLSVQMFRLILSQQNQLYCKSFNKDQPVDIFLFSVASMHQEWLNNYKSKGYRLSTVNAVNTQYSFKLDYPLYNFIQKASPLNFQGKCDLSKRNQLFTLPKQYLSLQINNRIKIFRNKDEVKTLIYQSNLDQSFHLNIINNILGKEFKDFLQRPISQILSAIINNGNIQTTDLLVQDIFGSQMCGSIDLPPKLIASSLGKFANRHQVQFKLWDKLKSILVAFAINLGQQISKQMLATKVYITIFRTNQFNCPQFMHIVEGIVALFGQLWIDGQAALRQFALKLKLSIGAQ